MKRMVRNRVINQTLEGAQTHFEDYGPVYVAGAFGFLLGGLVVLSFSRRNNPVPVIVIR